MRKTRKDKGSSHLSPARETILRDAAVRGLTLQEIGEALGVSRERARQLLESLQLNEQRKQCKPPSKAACEKFRANFAAAAKRWLMASGYHRCCICKTWMEKSRMSTGSARCLECQSRYICQYMHKIGLLKQYYPIGEGSRKYPAPTEAEGNLTRPWAWKKY